MSQSLRPNSVVLPGRAAEAWKGDAVWGGSQREGMAPPWASKEENAEGQRIGGVPIWAAVGQWIERVSGGREYSLTYD